MENVLTKKQLLEFIRKNNIQSVSDIYESLKDSFEDVLQSFLGAEIEETLGYEMITYQERRFILNTQNYLYTQSFLWQDILKSSVHFRLLINVIINRFSELICDTLIMSNHP
ncbi:hypothetical protein Calow_2108 [Caldicellulosiruptor owensensis OL]|uniref:Uncharacterized protein n=1 Tax=Caldicellulosiruptor owensensis (strain ATCC 700167 / DSM 13100 / OL) TaxID=632518 RepID=E4Q6L1_CALOW|nr:hypothetical protein Calow_2108 [Caldicellulosiruptor owensensis OL]